VFNRLNNDIIWIDGFVCRQVRYENNQSVGKRPWRTSVRIVTIPA